VFSTGTQAIPAMIRVCLVSTRVNNARNEGPELPEPVMGKLTLAVE